MIPGRSPSSRRTLVRVASSPSSTDARALEAPIRQSLPVLLDVHLARIGPVAAGSTVVAFLLSPVAVFDAGYLTGTHTEVVDAYGGIALAFGIVRVATFCGFPVVVLAGVAPAVERGAPGLSALAATRAVFRAADFAIAGLAGAAVAHFRARQVRPASSGGPWVRRPVRRHPPPPPRRSDVRVAQSDRYSTSRSRRRSTSAVE